MPNQTKVFVQEGTFHQQEISYHQLISELTNQYSGGTSPELRIRAARTIGALGILAADAVTQLEHIVYSANDITLVQACLNALEKISPKYRENGAMHGIHARMASLKKLTPDNNAAIAAAFATAAATAEPEKKKKKMNDVQIVQADSKLGAKMSRKCNFCEKETVSEPESQRLCDLLCQPNKFYCNFCLRHSLNMKDNKHVLMMTFRAIFGYYYYEFYQTPKSPLMYLSEIQDYIDLHRDTGLTNPIFSYDPTSYIWFVDFRRVGAGKKKITVDDVKKTVIDILASFNLATTIMGVDMNKLYQKYAEAIDDFYTKRYRPEGKRLLAPTLKNCGNVQWGGVNNAHWQAQQIQQQQSQKMTLEDTKGFLPHLISPEKYWQKTAAL